MKQKNIKHIWSVLAESSIEDKQTNNISIHKVLEQLNVKLSILDPKVFQEKVGADNKFAINFPFQIISLWQKNDIKNNNTAEVEMELFDPNQTSLQKVNFTLIFEENKSRMRTVITSSALNITIDGVYLFTVSMKESGEKSFQEVAEIPLEIKIDKN